MLNLFLSQFYSHVNRSCIFETSWRLTNILFCDEKCFKTFLCLCNFLSMQQQNWFQKKNFRNSEMVVCRNVPDSSLIFTFDVVTIGLQTISFGWMTWFCPEMLSYSYVKCVRLSTRMGGGGGWEGGDGRGSGLRTYAKKKLWTTKSQNFSFLIQKLLVKFDFRDK